MTFSPMMSAAVSDSGSGWLGPVPWSETAALIMGENVILLALRGNVARSVTLPVSVTFPPSK